MFVNLDLWYMLHGLLKYQDEGFSAFTTGGGRWNNFPSDALHFFIFENQNVCHILYMSL